MSTTLTITILIMGYFIWYLLSRTAYAAYAYIESGRIICSDKGTHGYSSRVREAFFMADSAITVPFLGDVILACTLPYMIIGMLVSFLPYEVS